MKNQSNDLFKMDDTHMRVLLESTNSIPWVINWASKEFTYVGPQIERILGFPRQSWTDASVWMERIHPEDRDRVANYCISQSEKGEDHYADYRAITSNGSYLWIRDVVHVIREDNATKEIVGFMFDITERKYDEEELSFTKKALEQANYALQKSNEQLIRNSQELKRKNTEQEIIFDSAPAFIICKDDQNNILRVNRAVADSLGLKAIEIEGKHSREVYPDQYEKYYADDLEVINSGKPKLGIVEPYQLESGETKWVQTDKVPYIDQNGKVQGIILFAIDITKQKEAESKAKEYATKLEQVNEELQNFASIASHDLQEPLRKIITFGDRLATRIPETDEQGNDYLNRMQNSALRMRSLVEDLLQYTKVETKVRPFEVTDLNKVVQTVLNDLEVRLKESEGVVNINSLPTIEADPVQLHQLFLNMIGNALKFHREGTPPVVNLDSVRKENGYWEICIEDNGIGIDEEHVDKIFKPFERLHGRTTYEGTGIGLTICNKIVSRHGGKITVKRQLTNGVTFHITLPEKQNHKSNH
jgi:PAS domain S-box-containing protein